MAKNIDIPVDTCPECDAGIWESMLSGVWLAGCNCKKAADICKAQNKKG